MAKLGQYNLEEMTEQEVFDAAAKHLMEQSEQSLYSEDGDFCIYKGDNKCCAAAIFIQGYDEKMESKIWYKLVSKFDQSDKHLNMVMHLQSVHDENEPSEWKKELERLSEYFDFNTDILEDYCWDDGENRYLLRESV